MNITPNTNRNMAVQLKVQDYGTWRTAMTVASRPRFRRHHDRKLNRGAEDPNDMTHRAGSPT